MGLRVEVINTGTELLLGSVLNTHLKFFAQLLPLGLRIERQLTVPDGAAIGQAVAETFGRADIVLITGGLGPTTDDITREEVAALLGLELVHDPEVMTAIQAFFNRRSLPITDRVGRQAMRPPQSLVLKNLLGTAPGLYLAPLPLPNSTGCSPHLFLLPGPPRELHPMFVESVLPILRELLPHDISAGQRTYRVTGLGESQVEAEIGQDLLELGIELGYCARPGEVEIRIIGNPARLEQAGQIISTKLGNHVISSDGRSLEEVVVALLTGAHQTVATAESCTGGYLAHRITNVSGASAVLLAGYVTYANESKIRDLSVDPALIEMHGAVSPQVAEAMANGALQRSGADLALATTGIAGPGGGTPNKPVGTVYIALASKEGATELVARTFPTDRETFKFLATQAALDLLRKSVVAAK